MTGKRFVYYEHKGADYILEEPKTHLDFIEMLGDCLDEKEIVDRLNELYEENEQLKSDNKSYVKRYGELFDEYTKLKEENKELKAENNRLIKITAETIAEHQRKVFDLIDKKIAEYEEKNHDANSGDCICVKYYNQIDALKELKKELSE